MDFCEPLNSYYKKINRKAIKVLSEIIPEDGPIINLLDKDGAMWSTDELRFRKSISEKSIIHRIIDSIGDGNDPLLFETATGVIAASQIETLNSHNSYLMYFLPGYTQASAVANIDLIETVFSMTNTIVDNIFHNFMGSDNFKHQQVHWMPELSFK